MDIKEEFDAATVKSKAFIHRPSNEELLELYSFYKQATEGDNIESRPGGFDFKAIAKHDAWDSKKGLAKDVAMADYVKLVNTLEEQHK